MTEFYGEVQVAIMTGQIFIYKVCITDDAMLLKCFIERDTGIEIKQQQLFYNKVNKQINNK